MVSALIFFHIIKLSCNGCLMHSFTPDILHGEFRKLWCSQWGRHEVNKTVLCSRVIEGESQTLTTCGFKCRTWRGS